MKFDLSHSIGLLVKTPDILQKLLTGLPEEWITANEGPDTWSPFDVVGHLVHGERTDWIPRIMIIMNDSDQKTFAPFDRFAQFEESKGKSIDQLLEEFAYLRDQNLHRLRAFQLDKTDLDRTGIHPSLGQVTLRQVIATWVAHDLGHLVQISRVMAKQYKDEIGPWTKYLSVIHA